MTIMDAPLGNFVIAGLSMPQLDTRDWTRWHLEHPYQKKGWQSHITPEEYNAALKAGFKGWEDKSAAHFNALVDKHGFGVKNSEPHLVVYNEAAKRAYAKAVKSGLTAQQMKWASTNKGTALAKKDKAAQDHMSHAEHLGAAHGWAQAAVEQKAIEKANGLGVQSSSSKPKGAAPAEAKAVEASKTVGIPEHPSGMAGTKWTHKSGVSMNFGTQSGWFNPDSGDAKATSKSTPMSFYQAHTKLKNESGWRKVEPQPAAAPKKAATKLAKKQYPLPQTTSDLAKLEKIGGPLGSNGGQWYKLPDGGKILVKPGKSPEHIYNEVAVNAVYAAAGAHVKETAVGPGGNVVVGRAIDPLTAITPQNITAADQKAAREHFGIDALTSNWDVFGLPSDPSGRNLFRGEGGKVYRLDNGGGGFFRAQGSPKGEAFTEGDWAQKAAAGKSTENDYLSMLKSDQGKLTYGTDAPLEDITASLNAAADLNLDDVATRMAEAGVPTSFTNKFLNVLESRQNHLKSMGYGTNTGSFDAGHNEALAHTKDNVPDVSEAVQKASGEHIQAQGHAMGLNVGKTMLANGKLPSEVHEEATILASTPNASIHSQGYAAGMHKAAYDVEDHPEFAKGKEWAKSVADDTMPSKHWEQLSHKWAVDTYNAHVKEYKLGAAEALHAHAESLKTGAVKSSSSPTANEPKVKQASDVKIGDKVSFDGHGAEEGTTIGSSSEPHEVVDTYTTKSGKSTLLVTKDKSGTESEHMVPAVHAVIVHTEAPEATPKPSWDRTLQTGPDDESMLVHNLGEGQEFAGGYTIGDTFQKDANHYAVQVTGPHGTTYGTYPEQTTINKIIQLHEAQLAPTMKPVSEGGNPYPNGSDENKAWAKGYVMEGQYGLDNPDEVQQNADKLQQDIVSGIGDKAYKQGGIQAYKDQGAIIGGEHGNPHMPGSPNSDNWNKGYASAMDSGYTDKGTLEGLAQSHQASAVTAQASADFVGAAHHQGQAKAYQDKADALPTPSVAPSQSPAPKHTKTLVSVQAKNLKAGDIVVTNNGSFVKIDGPHKGAGPGALTGHEVGPISGAIDFGKPKVEVPVSGPTFKIQRITPAHPVWQAMTSTHDTSGDIHVGPLTMSHDEAQTLYNAIHDDLDDKGNPHQFLGTYAGGNHNLEQQYNDHYDELVNWAADKGYNDKELAIHDELAKLLGGQGSTAPSDSPIQKKVSDLKPGDIISGAVDQTGNGGKGYGLGEHQNDFTGKSTVVSVGPETYGGYHTLKFTNPNGSVDSWSAKPDELVTVHSSAEPSTAPNRPNVKVGGVELTHEDALKLKAQMEDDLDSSGNPSSTVAGYSSLHHIHDVKTGTIITGDQWQQSIPMTKADNDKNFLNELNKQLGGSSTPEQTPTGTHTAKASEVKVGDKISGGKWYSGNPGPTPDAPITVTSVGPPDFAGDLSIGYTTPSGEVWGAWGTYLNKDSEVTIHGAGPTTATAQPSVSVPKGNKQAKVMAKNLKVGDQVLDKNGTMAGKVTKHNAPQGTAGPHEITVEWSNGETSTQTAPEPTTKITKINPNHPKYIGGSAPTSATSMGETPKAVSSVSWPTAPSSAEFAGAFDKAVKLSNKGYKEQLPQQAVMSEDDLKGLNAYAVARARTKLQHGDLSDEDALAHATEAQSRIASSLTPAEQAKWLGIAHGFTDLTRVVAEPEESGGEVDLAKTPEYATAKADAEAKAAGGATSRDLYAKAYQYQGKTSTGDKARFQAWYQTAANLDSAENEKPTVGVTAGAPAMTDAQIASMTESAKPATNTSHGDLEMWAYNQGRAMGVDTANTIRQAVADGDTTYSPADLEAAAIKHDELAKTTVGLLQRKHMGIAKTLHRSALAWHNGEGPLSTSATDSAPKPNVMPSIPGSPESGGGFVQAGAHQSTWFATEAPVAPFTSKEKSLIGSFTGPYRWSSSAEKGKEGAHPSFYSAMNMLMDGQQPTGSGADDARAFVKMCAEKSVPAKHTIYRKTSGIELKSKIPAMEKALAAGKPVDLSMPLQSSSYGEHVWSGHFWYVIEPGALTCDIGQFGVSSEIETVTGGLFEVTKIEHVGGDTKVYLRQKVHYTQ